MISAFHIDTSDRRFGSGTHDGSYSGSRSAPISKVGMDRITLSGGGIPLYKVFKAWKVDYIRDRIDIRGSHIDIYGRR